MNQKSIRYAIHKSHFDEFIEKLSFFSDKRELDGLDNFIIKGTDERVQVTERLENGNILVDAIYHPSYLAINLFTLIKPGVPRKLKKALLNSMPSVSLTGYIS